VAVDCMVFVKLLGLWEEDVTALLTSRGYSDDWSES